MIDHAVQGVSESEPEMGNQGGDHSDHWRALAVFLAGILVTGSVTFLTGLYEQKVINANIWARVERESNEWKIHIESFRNELADVKSAQVQLPQKVAVEVLQQLESRSLTRDAQRKN